jgi:hypothetical protein
MTLCSPMEVALIPPGCLTGLPRCRASRTRDDRGRHGDHGSGPKGRVPSTSTVTHIFSSHAFRAARRGSVPDGHLPGSRRRPYARWRSRGGAETLRFCTNDRTDVALTDLMTSESDGGHHSGERLPHFAETEVSPAFDRQPSTRGCPNRIDARLVIHPHVAQGDRCFDGDRTRPRATWR